MYNTLSLASIFTIGVLSFVNFMRYLMTSVCPLAAA